MKKAIVFVSAFFLICFALPVSSNAAALCCQISSGVQESMSGVAAPAAEEVTIQLNYSFTRMDTIKEGSTERSLSYVKTNTMYMSLPVSMDMVKYTLTAGYGFSPKLKAFVSVPHVRNTMDMEMYMDMGMGMGYEWMVHAMEPVSDLGDITVMGLYRLSTDRDVSPTEAVTLGFGIKTASGSATIKKSNGEYVHAHMQPGTGSWDPLVSLMYAKKSVPFLIQADATYQYTTKNRENYEFGDSLALNAGVRYAVIDEFNIAAGLTYLTVGKAEDPDNAYNPDPGASLMDDPANTGGDSLWFSPGIQVMPVANGMLDLKVQVPVWEKVNGIQLVSSYRVLLGISYNF